MTTTNTVPPPGDNHPRRAAIRDLNRHADQQLAAHRTYLRTLIPTALNAADADEAALHQATLRRGIDLIHAMSPRDLLDLAATLEHLGLALADRDAQTTTSRRGALRLVKAGA